MPATEQPIPAFPLAWPDGWPRTPPSSRQESRHRFARGAGPERKTWSFQGARNELARELKRLGAEDGWVITSNFPTRLDGLPKADGRLPEDQGIAIYYRLRGKLVAMACDLHVRAEENMRSLALSIEALRQLERHGGGKMMEKAFTGFLALPPPRHWTTVLGIGAKPAEADVISAYRSKAKAINGVGPGMYELNRARDEALRQARGET